MLIITIGEVLLQTCIAQICIPIVHTKSKADLYLPERDEMNISLMNLPP